MTSVGEDGPGFPGLVQIYELDFDELLAAARERVIRGFTEAECSRFPDVDPCP